MIKLLIGGSPCTHWSMQQISDEPSIATALRTGFEKPEPKVTKVCDHCKEPIQEGEEIYDFSPMMDIQIHEDCLYDWAKEFLINYRKD